MKKIYISIFVMLVCILGIVSYLSFSSDPKIANRETYLFWSTYDGYKVADPNSPDLYIDPSISTPSHWRDDASSVFVMSVDTVNELNGTITGIVQKVLRDHSIASDIAPKQGSVATGTPITINSDCVETYPKAAMPSSGFSYLCSEYRTAKYLEVWKLVDSYTPQLILEKL